MEKKNKDQFQDERLKKGGKHDEEIHQKDPQKETGGGHDNKHQHIERDKK